jgi:hypothetical protein
MSYKVFDFVCKNKKCKGSHPEKKIADVLINLETEPLPVCPICGGETEILAGTDWVPHVSWGKWHV